MSFVLMYLFILVYTYTYVNFYFILYIVDSYLRSSILLQTLINFIHKFIEFFFGISHR